MIIAILILLGLCFGSFANALVWRLHQKSLPKQQRKASDKDLSITKGRSMCTDCGHTLGLIDLVPVFSWLSTRGNCRYCGKPIHWHYPLVEASMAALYVVSYISWPYDFNAGGVASFAVWCVALIGLVALIIYDARWMLLPNKIIAPLTGLALAGLVVRAVADNSFDTFLYGLLAGVIGGGIFYVLFHVSKGRWIGGGDVKLGFILGLLVIKPEKAFLVIFIASLLGSIVTLPLLGLKIIPPKTRIPFGPFLIAATIITMLFGQQIIDAYLRFVGL